MNRVAFVIPWFGPDLVGGAEQHIFQVTTRLAKRRHRVEVLTTCCRSFADDWGKNHYSEGTINMSGVLVRRFPVRSRNESAFTTANRELLDLNERRKLVGACPVSDRSARVFVEENIHSPKLLDYLEGVGKEYRNIVFCPYLYGPTLLGVERARERAVLQPLLHDETYAYLPQVEAAFHAARRILFISEGEAALALRLFGPSMLRKGVVTGAGVEEAPSTSASGANHEPAGTLPAEPYVLYVGRRDPAKKTDLLIRAFRKYRSHHPNARLKLALVGPGDIGYDAQHDGIVDLGLVSRPAMANLLANCRLLLQPSRNESYSRTVMEAWRAGVPVAVHGECIATRTAVECAGGGWIASTEDEWAALFDEIERTSHQELTARGARGREYARTHADWDAAVDRYETALDLRTASRPRSSASRAQMRAIHQLLPNLAPGDAISHHAMFIREILCELGYRSEIFFEHVDHRMAAIGTRFKRGAIGSADGVIYHHSIGTHLAAEALRHSGPKALIYHNITPASFFESWDPAFARLLDNGRKELRRLAPGFPVSCGVSQYNAAELRSTGFRNPRVLPLFIDPLRWAQFADPDWMRVLQDGRTNLLFVGRISPNKCQHDLLEAFREYLSFDLNARLVLVGGWREGDSYAAHVRDLARARGLGANVLFTGPCGDAQLLACYRTAHLFWSMSEHEGFCAPLVEAMWFDTPVLAYRSSAIPETLADAGLMFTEKKYPEVAALANLLVEDGELRHKIVQAQATRRADFLPEKLLPRFIELIEALTRDRDSVRAVS